MDNEINYSYDAKFEGNILVVGKTDCGRLFQGICTKPWKK